jgi:hypothetical protein
MLIVVNDDAQVHAIHRGIAVVDANFARKILGGFGQVSLPDGFERALEPVDDAGFGSHRLFHSFVQASRHPGTGDAQQRKILDGDVHVDFAGGAHTRRGTPGEFFLRSGLRESNQLTGHVAPLAVIALPESVECGLRVHGARSERSTE